MDLPYSRYYSTAYKLSSIAGIWPYLKPKTKLFRLSLVLVATVTVLIPQVAYQYMCKLGLKCTAQNLALFIVSILVVIMMYTFQSNARIIKTLTEHLFIDWEELKDPEEYNIMKSYAENSNRFSLLYTIYCFLTTYLFILMSLEPFILDIILPLNESRPILPPYPSYYFVDTEEYFFQIFLHTIMVWTFIVIGIQAHDCMFITYVEHICSSFAVVGYRFEHLVSNETIGIKNICSDDECCKRVAWFVDKHQKTLEMAQLVEDIFSIPYIMQLLMATIGMSITLLQITQYNDNGLETLKYVAYVVIQLIHLFILNFKGQQLMDHSLQMRDRIKIL
ncbi:uncharacterized protein LOC105277712 isoform X2 [Ooceraea biroi]|uniref:uncharacterized protein LOC105277712 isoform X2 n=1 Tax=Ooceraea biroi TaxID=2015173 RepID=UPI0009715E23|nr:uncharacterized protein LOC105277712 isoform X2 [Ooceraea biroi]